MNPKIIKEEIKKHLGEDARIVVSGMRGKKNIYEGQIKAIYPNIFSIIYQGNEKSFSYHDIITGTILIKYK